MPSSPILDPDISEIIPNACIFPSLPWSVPIPVVVYLFTCSIDLKPSLNANFISFAVASFWKSTKDFIFPTILSEGSNHIFLFDLLKEVCTSKFS